MSGPTKRQLTAMREVRIFDFCIQHANEIIGELHSSGGDHSEDVEILDGLIEGWEHLRGFAYSEAEWAEVSEGMAPGVQ